MEKILCKEEKGQPKPICAITYTPHPSVHSLPTPVIDPVLNLSMLTELGYYRQTLPPFIVLSTVQFRHDSHQDNQACLKNWNRYIEYLYHGDGGKGSRKAGILRIQDDQNNRRRQGIQLQPGDILINPPSSLPSDTLEIIYIINPPPVPTILSKIDQHTIATTTSSSSTTTLSSSSSSSSSSSTVSDTDNLRIEKLLDVQDMEALLPGIVNSVIVEEVRYAHSQLNDTLRATIREELQKQKEENIHLHQHNNSQQSSPSSSSAVPAVGSSMPSGTLSGHSRSRSEYEAINDDQESMMNRPQDVYENHGIPLVDKSRLVKRRGPEYDALINDVVNRIVQGHVRFPLKRTFIKPKELVKWFLKLRSYSVQPRLYEPYDLYGYFHENKKATCIVERRVLPPQFGGSTSITVASTSTTITTTESFHNDSNLYSVDYSEAEMLIFAGKGHIIIPFDKTMQIQDTALVDFFTEEARVISRRKDESASIVELFRTPELSQKAVSKAIGKYGELTPFSLRHGLFGHVSGPSLFKAQVALACYDLFGAQRVLDMCAGWGVHLMGALASPLVNRYQAFEPNTTLRLGHTSMIKVFNDKVNGDYNVEYVPFEHGNVGTVPYDLIFTSPPYFDVEVYQSATQDDHNRQSIQSFPSLQSWLKGWLFPAMDKAYNALRVGGHMALYINDFEGLHMCRPMVNYAATMPDCRWLGIIGIEGETGKTRPLWVWRKGPMTKLCKLYKIVFPEAHEPSNTNPNTEETNNSSNVSISSEHPVTVHPDDNTVERKVRQKMETDEETKEKNNVTAIISNSNTEI